MGKDKIKIPDEVKLFANADEKKYLKKAKKNLMYDKKESTYQFYASLLDSFPDVIDWLVFYSRVHEPDFAKTKKKCKEKLAEDTFLKLVMNELKTGNKIKNYKLLPFILGEMLTEANNYNEKSRAEAVAEGKNEVDEVDVENIVALSKLCMKKNAKKLRKACGTLIDDDMIFDILTVFPCKDIVILHTASHWYFFKLLLNTLYEISKTKKVPLKQIISVLLIGNDEQDKEFVVRRFILQALLEKKDIYNRLSDPQRVLWNEITEYCVSTLESLPKKECREVIEAYIKRRSKEDRQNRDGHRRIQLSALSESDYPRIASTVASLKAKNNNDAKYL